MCLSRSLLGAYCIESYLIADFLKYRRVRGWSLGDFFRKPYSSKVFFPRDPKSPVQEAEFAQWFRVVGIRGFTQKEEPSFLLPSATPAKAPSPKFGLSYPLSAS